MHTDEEKVLLAKELEAIQQRHGVLTPQVVVEEAKNEWHPLHDRFEWDDAVAGAEYRLVQARGLIKSVRVKFIGSDDQPADVRAWVSVTRPGTAERVYEKVEDVVADPALRELVLREFERAWKTLRDRYGHLLEFAGVILSDLEEKD